MKMSNTELFIHCISMQIKHNEVCVVENLKHSLIILYLLVFLIDRSHVDRESSLKKRTKI